MGITKDFLNGNPVTEEMKQTVDKWDLVKLRRFSQQKAKTAEWKAAYRMGRKSTLSFHMRENHYLDHKINSDKNLRKQIIQKFDYSSSQFSITF